MQNVILVALEQLRAPALTREERNVRRLLALSGLVGIVQGGIVAFLPVFLVRLGASTVTISLLTSLPAIVTVVTALPSGALAARWRRIVPVSAAWFYALRFCYLAVAVAGLFGPGLAPTLIVAIWGLSAIPSTIANAVWYDVLAEAIPARRRPVVNGTRWALLGLLSAGSVALFGQLLEALPFPVNYQVVFVISFLAGVLNIRIYSQIEVPDREPSPRQAGVSLGVRARGFLRPLTERGFLAYVLVAFAMRVGLFLPSGLYSIFWVRDLGASEALIGLRSTVENLALTVGYYLWGRLTGRFGSWRIFAAAMVGVAVAKIVTGLVTPQFMPLLFVAALIGGAFAAGIDVSLFELLLRVMPPDERPRYVALNMVLAHSVIFVVPLVGAAVAEQVGIRPVLFVAAGCLLACAGLAYRLFGMRPAPADEVPALPAQAAKGVPS